METAHLEKREREKERERGREKKKGKEKGKDFILTEVFLLS